MAEKRGKPDMSLRKLIDREPYPRSEYGPQRRRGDLSGFGEIILELR